MLQHLQARTCPDITCAVNQRARCSSDPKESHARAVKCIARCLKGTREKGLPFSPTGKLAPDCCCDADFCGNWAVMDPTHPSSVKSRNGHVLTVSGCPFHWASKPQTLAALSSTESEMLCLSKSTHHLPPLREIVDEIREHAGLEKDCPIRMKSKAFEDDNGCIAANTCPKITPRSRHIGSSFFSFKDPKEDVVAKKPVAIKQSQKSSQTWNSCQQLPPSHCCSP